MSRLPGPTQRRVRGPEDPSDPEKMQRYADYMILDPSRSSVHMQTPLLDPYTYHQVRCSSGSCGLFLPPGGQNVSRRLSLQQQYGYQEEEERSLNSLDDNPAFPLLAAASRSRSRGDPLDRDQQLLQDLVSFYLNSPSSSSSSSSSSPVQSLSHHRGAAAAGFPSSSSSSSSSFFPDLDFPLDYGEDYVSQVAQLREQQQQQQQAAADKKAKEEYNALSGLDGEREERKKRRKFYSLKS